MMYRCRFTFVDMWSMGAQRMGAQRMEVKTLS